VSRFVVTPTPLRELVVLERKRLDDERGTFERLYCSTDLAPLIGDRQIVQINRTLTRHRGVVRGMHFQYPPHAEYKLVSCLRGQVYDVAVDIRSGSPTFLRWHAEILTEDNRRTLFIPEGFAHGFQTLTSDCEMLYFHTAPYSGAAESGISPTEPKLGIGWPLPIRFTSERDASRAPLDDAFGGVSV